MDDRTETPIPGLMLFDIAVHGDSRGWFKENWQREKMIARGLPDFGPVQHNVSFNGKRGATRGIHAEPWDKMISILQGRIFGAWVDLREGDTFGQVFTAEIGLDTAVYVPRGVGNSYQALEDDTVYSYLVNHHWHPEAAYTFVHLGDPDVGVEWPIPLAESELSDKDKAAPALAEIEPFRPAPAVRLDSPRTLILGADGQLGRALRTIAPSADARTRATFDLTDEASFDATDWSAYDVVVNAAAYTKVDDAETVEGRRASWQVNAHAPARLARVAIEHDLVLVHVSTDYVFDGEQDSYSASDSFAPLGSYGASKAAGDLAVALAPKHYVVRTSWVVGDGPNFVATMQRLAENGVDPAVVDDQVGLLTRTEDLARRIGELIERGAEPGTYNVTSGGTPQSWFEIARQTFADAGHDPERVSPVSTAEYGAGKAMAPRPRRSVLSTDG